ncbi:MAG: transposase [Brevinematia bacterium]
MSLFMNKYRNESIRLKGWDYSSPGAYFVTICVKERMNILSKVINGEVILSEIGKIVDVTWNEIPSHFENVKLDYYVIMPDHIHGIIIILENDNVVVNGVDDIFDGRNAINRVPTIENTENGYKNGGITGIHNPMLTKNSLSKIVRWFKGRCTYEIRRSNLCYFQWQSRFYDHIIRNGEELKEIRKYILDNPKNLKNYYIDLEDL